MRASRRSRSLHLEHLEPKTPLAADAVAEFVDWQNESKGTDVNADGYTTPLDALNLIRVLADYGAGTVTDIQESIRRVDPDAAELKGGFLPDVDGDGSISPLDALAAITELPSNDGLGERDMVAVMPDPTGRPLELVYTSTDGLSHSIDLRDRFARVSWENGNATISEFFQVTLMARPGAGTLELTRRPDGDRMAVVTRYDGGQEIIERYVCAPLIGVDDDGFMIDIELPPDDPREPIAGFPNTVGAIVSREIRFEDGSQTTETYTEANLLEQPLSATERLETVTAELTPGNRLEVDVLASIAEPDDVQRLRAQMLDLLSSGYIPTAPITLEQLAEELQQSD